MMTNRRFGMQPPHFPYHYVSQLSKTILAISIIYYISRPWRNNVVLTWGDGCNGFWNMTLYIPNCGSRQGDYQHIFGTYRRGTSVILNIGPISASIMKDRRGGIKYPVMISRKRPLAGVQPRCKELSQIHLMQKKLFTWIETVQTVQDTSNSE